MNRCLESPEVEIVESQYLIDRYARVQAIGSLGRNAADSCNLQNIIRVSLSVSDLTVRNNRPRTEYLNSLIRRAWLFEHIRKH